uniref:ATP-dependent Clp protease proteolytic subunit n=1 Tax=Rhipilia penicilloides TaxID=1979422 RepID=A0A2P0QHN1_9CHLO|nr:clp protease proteolytic subunit [Rhipilia penicilloides]ARO74281.1 clp protease proteolytic subunit [Rhipilia penicilloides]
MPIGVPKIPFKLPGEPAAEWVDLYNRLYRERVLFLCQPLDDELANQLIGIMLYLNGEERSKDIYIYINSPGGSVTCGIGLYDIMNYIQPDVTTICVGTAASMASFILTGGARGKRLAFPHARMMIHQPEGGSQGQAAQVLWESEQVRQIRRQVGHIYAERTGQPLNRISQDMDRDQFMSAREAQNYGLVDHLAESV